MAIGAAIGSVVGGLVQAGAARSAASAQERAAERQLDVQQQMFEQSREDLSPYRDSGLPAVNALNYYLGIGPRPTNIGGTPANITTIPGAQVGATGPQMPYFNTMSDGGLERQEQWLRQNPNYNRGTTSPERFSVNGQIFDTREQAQAFANANLQGGSDFVGFQETPGFQFALDQGRRAVDASAAARGGLFSGATIQAQQDRGIGMANQEFGNYLSRLEGTATRGQNAAAQSATVNTNNAQMQSNSLANIGNAQAAGAIGVGNAFSGAINNGIGLWQYQNMLNRFSGAPG